MWECAECGARKKSSRGERCRACANRLPGRVLPTVRRPFVEWAGVRWYLGEHGYWENSRTDATGLERMLHRAVWAAENGPIPKGFDVHHLDGDKRNWQLDNLLAISRRDHHALHPPRGFELWGPEKWAESGQRMREWWRDRPMREATCRECGEGYTTKCLRETHYCSRRCADKVMGRRRRERARARVQPDGGG